MPRFLLDENVRIELFKFLRSEKLDVKRMPKSTGDATMASVSKKGRRVLITNDEDFVSYRKEKVFGVIWLRIPQNQPDTLVHSFAKLLREYEKFEGKVVTLQPTRWFASPLGLT